MGRLRAVGTRERRSRRGAVVVLLAMALVPIPALAQAAEGPTLTVEPATELIDGQQVRVVGQGFVDQSEGSTAVIVACAAGSTDSSDCASPSEYAFLDDGQTTFELSVLVEAVLTTIDGDEVDCRVEACVLAALGESGDRLASAPVAFDVDAPLLPLPSLTVIPDQELVDGQTVTVEGEDFPERRQFYLAQCAPHVESFDECSFTGGDGLSGDRDGHLSTQAVVFAEIRAGDRVVDCRTSTEPCQLVVAARAVIGPRTPRADLHFDPEGSLAPPPQITVDPSTAIADGATVQVAGTGFTAGGPASIEVCESGADPLRGQCGYEDARWVDADDDGRFQTEVRLYGDFTTFDDDGGEGPAGERTVDCRQPPGCDLVGVDRARDRVARVPITFAPLPPPRPLLDPTFDEVEVTRDILYRTTTDVDGNPVELRLDVWQPGGDTSASRPAVLWMHGGYFIFGDRQDMDPYARDFARRGYVAVSVQYRLREDLETSDVGGIVEASYDAYDDALAAVAWLESRADQYRIDTDRIAAGGYSAGAITALNLAYLPGQRGPATSPIDAAVSIAGLTFGVPEAGEPPSLAFHGTADDILPYASARASCGAVVDAGPSCDLVTYDGAGHEIASSERRDIVRRTAEFLRAVLPDDPDPPTSPQPTVPLSTRPLEPPPPSGQPAPATPAAPLTAAANFTG